MMASRYGSPIAVLLGMLICLLPGCVDYWYWDVLETIYATLDKDMPSEILTVEGDPERFRVDEHPLADVAVGTVLDDLSGLTGCWGGYYPPGEDADEAAPISWAEVLKFDLVGGTLTRHVFSQFRPDSPIIEDVGGASLLTTFVSDLEIRGTNRVVTKGVGGAATAFDESGRPVFTPFVLAVFFHVGQRSEDLVTLSGDHLKTGAVYDNELDETTVQSWFRLECADE